VTGVDIQISWLLKYITSSRQAREDQIQKTTQYFFAEIATQQSIKDL